ncbi:MAG TPA: alanine--tRNA ligase-related protein, partial [Candidatus Paceibacterota bacterium]|nr:alanine--tRNA ligase-related protein [Candidatus Paceibacterota bacterium]
GVEVWNIVFNEFYKTKAGTYEPLETKGIDTGMGLERLLVQVQKKNTVYETDLFAPALAALKQEAERYDERSARILADHVRSALFLLADGVLPGNKDQGYILRRLIRRAVLQAKTLGLVRDTIEQVAEIFQQQYEAHYPEVRGTDLITSLTNEKEKFKKTLEQGLKEFEKGTDPFVLATTYGFPIELTEELAREKGVAIDRATFDEQMKKHQDTSRAGLDQKFKGGLADHSEHTVKLHTAHHLLLAALQHVLGKDVKQRGSNITEERLRIDFSFERKMTDEEKKKVEDMVNDWIARDLSVVRREMPKEEAEKLGAEMEFGAKYGETVSVYFIEDNDGTHISKEFCGGPHVTHTGALGTFKIQKEEAVAAGIRRIKATLS